MRRPFSHTTLISVVLVPALTLLGPLPQAHAGAAQIDVAIRADSGFTMNGWLCRLTRLC